MGMRYNADTETWEYVDDGDLSVFDNYAGTDLTAGVPVYTAPDPSYVAPDSTGTAGVDENGNKLPSFSSSSIPTGLSSLLGSLKGAFVDENNNINWNTALPVLGGLFGAYQSLSGANNPNTTKVGYQGSIPKLQATRTRLPIAADPNRRPGSGGRNYFSDVQYTPKAAAEGGLMGLAEGGATGEPRYLAGHTDGMADELPASIDDKQPAKLSHGEFVIPADVVGHLGNGNSEAGAKRLYEMMARIRKARTGNPDQGKRINPNKFLPS